MLETDVEEFKRRGRKMMQDEPAKEVKAPGAPTKGKSSPKVAPDDGSASDAEPAKSSQNGSCHCSML